MIVFLHLETTGNTGPHHLLAWQLWQLTILLSGKARIHFWEGKWTIKHGYESLGTMKPRIHFLEFYTHSWLGTLKVPTQHSLLISLPPWLNLVSTLGSSSLSYQESHTSFLSYVSFITWCIFHFQVFPCLLANFQFWNKFYFQFSWNM